MPCSIKFEKKLDCICINVQGVLDLNVLRAMAAEVAGLVAQNSCRFVLNDMRQAMLSNGIYEVCKMPQAARAQGLEQATKRALVVPENAPEFNFLETVFVNKGHVVRLFTDLDAAKKWLFSEN